MNARCHVKFFRRCIEVERAEIGPKLHDAEPVEQRNFLLQCNPTHVFGIGTKGNHRFCTRAILRIDENNVGTRRTSIIYALVEGLAELIGINGQHRIDGAGLPDHQRGLGRRQRRRHDLRHIRGAAPGLHVGRHLDLDAGQLVGERLLQPRRISVLGAVGSRQQRRAGADDQDVEPFGGNRAERPAAAGSCLRPGVRQSGIRPDDRPTVSPLADPASISNASRSGNRPIMRCPPRSPSWL